MLLTLQSISILLKILWYISSKKKKIQVLIVLIFTILSSFLQYINIILTALTFSFISSISYSNKEFFELDFIFWNKIQLQNDNFYYVVLFWIFSSIITYSSAIISSFALNKLAYSLGKSLSNKTLSLSIKSNSIFFENISEKTLFNLLTSENTMLIKGSIMSLIMLPMQITVIIALVTIIVKYSFSLLLILPIICLFYFLISNVLFKSVATKGAEIFDLRSIQTDILSRIIDNYLDVKFPPSDKAYKNLFNKNTNKLRNLEAFTATIPKVLRSLLELMLILLIGLYIFYSLYLLNLPIEIFISSSAAILLSLFKLTPILSGLTSVFISFNSQYELIKNYKNILFGSDKYSLYSNSFEYSKLIRGKKYELLFENLISKRIPKYSINSLSMRISDKKLIWITGRSGCGKSTFLSMVAGIRPLEKGAIKLLVNNKNIKNEFIQNNIAYMPQNPIFHSTKIIDFISDGDTNLNLTRIKTILKKLRITDSFGMNDENILDTIIGPRGYAPSGGQAKLLAFARALYKKNVYLYLLDEPTSDLNNELKELVLQNIFNISKEKFVLCITHDLKLIRSQDERIYL